MTSSATGTVRAKMGTCAPFPILVTCLWYHGTVYNIYTYMYSTRQKKLPINGPFNGATVPVQIPFKTRTNPVRVSRSQRPVLIPVLTAVQTAVSCLYLCDRDGAARPQQRALGSTRV